MFYAVQLTTNKIDLCSAFLFIYGQVKTGPLRFFCSEQSVLNIKFIFYKKYTYSKEFTIKYDFELEKYIYNYQNNKLDKLSNLFKGSDILNNFYSLTAVRP